MSYHGPLSNQTSLFEETEDLEGLDSQVFDSIFSELLKETPALILQSSLDAYIPSTPITQLPPALPLEKATFDSYENETSTITESQKEKRRSFSKGKKRKVQDDADVQEEIDRYQKLTKSSEEDQVKFKKTKELMLKSQIKALPQHEADELRALRNLYSARISRAKKNEQKESLVETTKALKEENQRLNNEKSRLTQRITELETKLKLFQENPIERLFRTNTPNVLGQYYVSLQRANLRNSLSSLPAHADTAELSRTDAAAAKPS